MPDSDILIVGGGPAGLTTAGALKQAGMEATILDSGERIGQSWEQHYDRLRLHTVRAHSGLAHFPIPSTYPKYLSKDQYASYLRDYAAHFELDLVPGVLVKRIRQVRTDGRMGWAVEAGPETWTARVVVVSAGQYSQPNLPEEPGLAQYGGETSHAYHYRTGRTFHGQRVLVIGAGNTGMEIAADLAEQGAANVAISVRTAPPVVPRDFLGVPAQVFGLVMSAFPPALGDRIAQFLSRLALGDLNRFGFPSPDWMPFSSHRIPVIDVGFVSALKAGKIGVRRAVRAFTATGVVFEDDRREAYDAVIFATGYRPGLDQMLEPDGLLDQHGNPLFPFGTPACPGLYFMGYFESLRGLLYESNLASRRLAQEIKAASIAKARE